MSRAVRDRVRNNNYQGELADPARNPRVWYVLGVEFDGPTLVSAPGYVLLGASAHGRLYWSWAPTSAANEMELCFLNHITGMPTIGGPQPIIESHRFNNNLDLRGAFPSLPMYRVVFDRREI